MDSLLDTVVVLDSSVSSPEPESVQASTSTVPQVGNYQLATDRKGKYRLRQPDGKLIAEAFDTESDAKWYATRLTRLAGLWALQAAGGKKVFMPKVPGNVQHLTIAPHPKGWAVQDTDLSVIGPVWTDKRNGKVDAFRFAERCIRLGR